MTAYRTVSTSVLLMKKEESDPVKPLLLATAEGDKIKFMAGREQAAVECNRLPA